MYRFCKRFEITDQAKTNKKEHPLATRLSTVQGFHSWLLYELQHSGEIRSEKYGRFPGHLQFHCDQIPIPFVFGGTRSKNPRGQQCRIAQPGSGLDKRQCTLHLTIRAEGEQIVKPILVFRGVGVGIRAEELVQYPENIKVVWQPKAWVDTSLFIDIIEDFGNDTADVREEFGEVMLAMDRLSSQKCEVSQEALLALNVYPVLTPANCTDVTAPVDHHIGAAIKAKMRIMYEVWIDQWERDGEPPLSASDRRLLLANWVSVAWEELKANGAHLIRQSFVETGFLVARDGSENHLIKMAGVKGYTVPRPTRVRGCL